LHPAYPAVCEHDLDAMRVGRAARKDAGDDPFGEMPARLILLFDDQYTYTAVDVSAFG
jgi:hypothetical protein